VGAVEEVRLPGGNLGGAVRAGDTVRRAAGPHTANVHALLVHLRAHGFPEAPEPLGLDERGREVLAFVPGDVPEYPLPAWALADGALVAVARLARRLHDASVGFAGDGVICHNDLAPYNTVYVAERPVAFIDWDFAAPGQRAWDLAHAAWRFVPLNAGTDMSETARRLRLLLDAYGLEDRAGFVELAARRMQALHDTIRDRAAAGDPAFAAMWGTRHSEQPLRDRAWALEHRAALAP
jgi:Ser/Thr protein kinase RdoA (MazF antagonist)